MSGAYLDNSATTRPDPRVVEVVLRSFREAYGNPSSLHASGRFARRAVDDAREKIAAALGAGESEIIFTSGATEANNLVLRGVCAGRGKHVVTSRVEHPSLLEPCSRLEKEGREISLVSVDGEGRVDAAEIQSALRPGTALVSIMWANNEVGTIQPLLEIAANKKTLLHSDAAQALGKVPISLEGIDLLTFSGHKIHGPKGIGGLFVRKGTRLEPFLLGGGQESGRLGGTENVALIAGLAEAVDIAVKELPENRVRMEEARRRLVECIQTVPGATLLGSGEGRLPNILNVRFEGVDAEAMVLAFDVEGIHVSSGSACASLGTEPSHVLLAMGLSREEAKTSLRFSVAADTREEELDHAVETIPRVISRLRSVSPSFGEGKK